MRMGFQIVGPTLLAAALVSAAGGCGQSAKCNPNTCGGCCDVTDHCQDGSTDAVCGGGGAQCVACPQLRNCVAHACTSAASEPLPCNLLTQDCLPGRACIWLGAGDPFCTVAGNLDAGTPCTASTGQCVPRTVCGGPAGSPTCTAYCDRGAGTPGCTGGKTCQSQSLPGDAGLCL